MAKLSARPHTVADGKTHDPAWPAAQLSDLCPFDGPRYWGRADARRAGQGAAPAVVNIYAQRIVQQRISPLFDDPFFQRFFGPNLQLPNRERVENSLGSGVILHPEGS